MAKLIRNLSTKEMRDWWKAVDKAAKEAIDLQIKKAHLRTSYYFDNKLQCWHGALWLNRIHVWSCEHAHYQVEAALLCALGENERRSCVASDPQGSPV